MLTEDELLELERQIENVDNEYAYWGLKAIIIAAPRLLAEVRRLREQAREDEDSFRFIAGRCQCRELCSCSDTMRERAIERLASRAKEGK